jgi:serine/threonine-protein kinase
MRTREIGDYQLLEPIGSGGFGNVYLAFRRGDDAGRRYAVKILHPEVGREAFAAAIRVHRLVERLTHPNVHRVIEASRCGEVHYLVTEYVAGDSLLRLLSRGPAAPALIAAVLADALAGLEAIHQARGPGGEPLGLIHRDVSPDNILVGLDGVARISDFDIVKATTQPDVTRPHQVKGKLSYMAPEQLSGDRLDHRVDVFSAGVILYNALTGTRLFTGSISEMADKILGMSIASPIRVGKRSPSVFDAICARALAREPGRRYASAAEMRQALLAAGAASVSRAQIAAWVAGRPALAPALTASSLAPLTLPSLAPRPAPSLAALTVPSRARLTPPQRAPLTPPTSLAAPRPSSRRPRSRLRTQLAACAVVLVLAGVAGASVAWQKDATVPPLAAAAAIEARASAPVPAAPAAPVAKTPPAPVADDIDEPTSPLAGAPEPAAVPASKAADARAERRARRRARRARRSPRDTGDGYRCPRRAAAARR